jgi:hypothetical protein
VSSNANLATLTVTGGELSPAFNANTQTYTVSVFNSVTSVTIAATVTAPATITDASGIGAKTLAVGDNVYTITVTAENGTTTKTYTVTVTRAAVSTNATLATLTVTGGTLTPAFAATTEAYTVSVANSVTSVTIAATAVAPATITVDSSLGAKTLKVGDNVYGIVVTAEDGTTTKTYTVTVTRAAVMPPVKSTNANLATLTVTGQTLSPLFSADNQQYTLSVANDVASVTIVATVADAGKATLTGDGAKDLTVGSNAFDVVVTAEDGTTTKTYTVTVTRAAPTVTGVSTQTLSLAVYPNPTTGVVYVDNEAGEEVVVYTLAGSVVVRTHAAVVDLSDYASGVYIIKVGGKSSKVVKK